VTFDLDRHLASLDVEKLATREGRLALSCTSSLNFALIYLPHHLKSNGAVSFSEAHLDWFRRLDEMVLDRPSRTAIAAPRSSGKTTVHFLIAPLFLGAFGHSRFFELGLHAGRRHHGPHHVRGRRGR
jgi:hypothetical protein